VIRRVKSDRITAHCSRLSLIFVEPMSRIRGQRRAGNGRTLVLLAITRRGLASTVDTVRHSREDVAHGLSRHSRSRSFIPGDARRMREPIRAENPCPTQEVACQHQSHDEGCPSFVCACFRQVPTHLTVGMLLSSRMPRLFRPPLNHPSKRTSAQEITTISLILQTILPRCPTAVKIELAQGPTCLTLPLHSVQEESHFRISDSLGTLPATLTSPSTTRAGVMKTPY
jgi:hypothetical protein